MFYQRLSLLFFTILFILTGCNSPVYNQTEGNAADVQIRTQEAITKSNASGKSIPSLIVKEGVYVDKTPISLASHPSWLKNKIVIRGDDLPFSYYSRLIAGGGGHHVLTHYQTGLEDGVKVSIDYSGSVRGALDLLAAKLGYVYTVNGSSVYWQAFITKTFDVAFMPGSTDYIMGKASGGGSVSNVASGGATGAVAVSAIIDDSASSQFSNLKANLSVWKDLESTIKQLLSPKGTVMVSESTTTVTVRDRPTNVDLVSKYIANLNQTLSRQVLIKVQVLNVTLENDFDWGINWNLMKKMLGTDFQLNMNAGTPISITPFTAGKQQFGIQGSPGVTSATVFINALNQQGKTSIVTEPRVVCLNNQVAVMRVTSSLGYLASVQTTSLAGSSTQGGASVTSQLTPGNVVTGLTLYVLPKIMGDKIYLQVSADISNNTSLTTISSQTGTVTATITNPQPGSAIIQVPNVTQKQFNQRSIIRSGDTLILSGYRQVSNQANAQQILTLQALGGKAAQQLSTETIILITPIILPGIA